MHAFRERVNALNRQVNLFLEHIHAIRECDHLLRGHVNALDRQVNVFP